MFAKLKKKVEDLEGSDLHKLANSITFSSSGGPEKSNSSNSIKSSPDNVAASVGYKGSTTSLSSMQGASKLDESDANQTAEKRWKQKLIDIENEWRVKVMVQEHEKEQIVKDRDALIQQKRKIEEEVKELKGYQQKWIKAEEDLKHLQETKVRESASMQLLLSNASVEIEDMKTRDDLLSEELSKKEETIKMLKSQLLLSGEPRHKSNEYENEEKDVPFGAGINLDLEKKMENEYKEKLQTLQDNLEAKNVEVRRLEKQLEQTKSSLDAMTQNWQDEKSHNMNLKDRICRLSEEKDSFAVRNADLSQQVSLSQQQLLRIEKDLTDLQEKFQQTEEENQRIKLLLADADARDENSERTIKLKSQIAELEAAFTEKNKTIKLQQQRLSDMKKTLQKELKTQSNDTDNLVVQQATSPAVAPRSPTLSSASVPVKTEMEEVNFKYLKHVIFKFLTSREYEAQHLTRAVSTLLKLTSDEEKLLKETLEWKMSWFRSRPDLGTGQSAMYIPPTH